jgi:hypothetical protein
MFCIIGGSFFKNQLQNRRRRITGKVMDDMISMITSILCHQLKIEGAIARVWMCLIGTMAHETTKYLAM